MCYRLRGVCHRILLTRAEAADLTDGKQARKGAVMEFRFWRFDDKASRGPEERKEAEAAEIAPGLWYVGTYHFCAYLLHTHGGPVVIDTCVRQAGDFFLSQLSRAGIEPREVAAVLHTHCHSDHVGNTARLASLSGAKIMIGAGDAPLLAEQTPVGRILCPGERVDFGDTAVTFFSAPGHTLGCGMYLTELGGERLCFVGDACGPYIFRDVRWEGDAEAFRASAERMKEVEADLFLPGHPDQTFEVSPEGNPRLSREQWHRYLDQRLRAMEQITAGGDERA